jgi:hypothetical protein
VTPEDFVEEYNGAPIDEFELAELIVSKVEPHSNLYISAFDMLHYRHQMNQILEGLEFEFG